MDVRVWRLGVCVCVCVSVDSPGLVRPYVKAGLVESFDFILIYKWPITESSRATSQLEWFIIQNTPVLTSANQTSTGSLYTCVHLIHSSCVFVWRKLVSLFFNPFLSAHFVIHTFIASSLCFLSRFAIPLYLLTVCWCSSTNQHPSRHGA